MRDQEDDELNHTPLADDNNQIMFDEEQVMKIILILSNMYTINIITFFIFKGVEGFDEVTDNETGDAVGGIVNDDYTDVENPEEPAAVDKFVYTNNKIFNAKNMSFIVYLLSILLFSQVRLL